MPIGDRLGRRKKRRIRDGDEYTIDDEDAIELEIPERNLEPPVETQGEPWGWTKGPPYPIGWRMDGKYGPETDMDTDGELFQWREKRPASHSHNGRIHRAEWCERLRHLFPGRCWR